jgi:hypothetical protein
VVIVTVIAVKIAATALAIVDVAAAIAVTGMGLDISVTPQLPAATPAVNLAKIVTTARPIVGAAAEAVTGMVATIIALDIAVI